MSRQMTLHAVFLRACVPICQAPPPTFFTGLWRKIEPAWTSLFSGLSQGPAHRWVDIFNLRHSNNMPRMWALTPRGERVGGPLYPVYYNPSRATGLLESMAIDCFARMGL